MLLQHIDNGQNMNAINRSILVEEIAELLLPIARMELAGERAAPYTNFAATIRHVFAAATPKHRYVIEFAGQKCEPNACAYYSNTKTHSLRLDKMSVGHSNFVV